MLVEHSKIDDQLEKIAAIRKRPLLYDDHERFETFFVRWRQRTTRLREVGARDRAWCTRRTQQMQAKAMAEWIAWLQSNRGVGAERKARKALAEAKRSASNYCFCHFGYRLQGTFAYSSCCRLQHRCTVGNALRTLLITVEANPRVGFMCLRACATILIFQRELCIQSFRVPPGIRRLSRALRCFRDTCVRSKHRRQLKVAFRTLRTLTQRRPIERAWCHWQITVRHMQCKAVLNAWAVAARYQRWINISQKAVCASKDVKLALSSWKRWRIQAGASSLTKLLKAWRVIGPVRRAIEILRDVTLEARATQHLRRRRLRCVPETNSCSGGQIFQHLEALCGEAGHASSSSKRRTNHLEVLKSVQQFRTSPLPTKIHVGRFYSYKALKANRHARVMYIMQGWTEHRLRSFCRWPTTVQICGCTSEGVCSIVCTADEHPQVIMPINRLLCWMNTGRSPTQTFSEVRYSISTVRSPSNHNCPVAGGQDDIASTSQS